MVRKIFGLQKLQLSQYFFPHLFMKKSAPIVAEIGLSVLVVAEDCARNATLHSV